MQCDVLFYDAENMDRHFIGTVVLPKICPHCQTGIRPTELFGAFYSDILMSSISVLFHCPSCNKIFVGIYDAYGHFNRATTYPLRYCLPQTPILTEIPENVNELFPRFVEVFHQSQKAESLGLDEICGMGYRKAVEILVKEFSIHLYPEKEEAICSQFLANCIDENIDNVRIKNLAKASAWLGNDEAHYVRRNEDYGLENLKAFIFALVSFINSDLEVEKATALIKK